MSKEAAEFRNDLGPLLDEAYNLVAATKNVSGNKIQAIRKRLAANLASVKELYQSARDATVEGARQADEYVHQNPYRVIGLCAGIGLIIGFILARRD